jgi:glycine betaine/proline transport system permease protein
MSTATAPPAHEPKLDPEGKQIEQAERPRLIDRVPRGYWLLGLAVVWVVLYEALKGKNTLALGARESTSVHEWFNHRRDDVDFASPDNPWIKLTHWISDRINSVFDYFHGLIAAPAGGNVVPTIGWLGVLGIAAWIALAIAGWRSAILVAASFASFGLIDYWEESMDLLIITFMAAGFAVVVGVPIALWMGNSKTATAVITPILDVLQTFPGLVYLLPLVIFFGLGAPTATIATLIFAFPPVIRIAAHGIRTVSSSTIEATTSLGQTRLQRVMKVQLPMAKATVVVGINQTIMAALSMATIAALVSGPGLGQPVVEALATIDVGKAFVPGLGIVIMAIMLDRVTTAASVRSERLQRAGGGNPRLRYAGLAAAAAVVAIMVQMSRTQVNSALFPDTSSFRTWLEDRIDSLSDRLVNDFDAITGNLRDQFTLKILNPFENLLAESPWWLTGAMILCVAALLAGRWALLSTAICLAGIYLTDLWHDSMITLASTLVATAVVMVLAVVFGVWMGRRRIVDTVLRPLLDAGQVMPPFVYLIPALALFLSGRFTAIVAAVIYAAPAAIKLVADGIRSVSATTIEAATAAGSNTWQIITKVQIPMARGSLVLAANQGLLYVLSMVVIGGTVGSGGLGLDVVNGIRQGDLFGRGFCAGIAIVLLGIMLDRITRGAAARSGPTGATH